MKKKINSFVDNVIEEIEKIEEQSTDKNNYLCEKVLFAIKKACGNNDKKIYQLYLEVLESQEVMEIIPMYFSLFAIWVSFIGFATNLINNFKWLFCKHICCIVIVLLIVTMLFAYFCFVKPFKDYTKWKYSKIILSVLNKYYKRIIN